MTVGNAALLTRGVIPHGYVIWLGVGVLLIANLLFQFLIWASSKYLHGMLSACWFCAERACLISLQSAMPLISTGGPHAQKPSTT